MHEWTTDRLEAYANPASPAWVNDWDGVMLALSILATRHEAEAQYAAYVAMYGERGEFESDYCDCDPLDFGDVLEAGMPYPHGMRF